MSATVGDAVNGSREMRLPEEESAPWHRASVTFTGRNYLFGAKIAAGRQLGHGWSGAAALHYRTGRDLRAEGVFTDWLSIGVRTAKRFGEEHSLTLLLVAAPSMRGLRSPSTEEAFTLTGDPLYNPAWGFQDGKVRNSHVRRQFEPFAAAIYRRRLSGATRLEATLGLRYGWQSYSSLGWYNARTPLPDNYRYLPSYTGDRATEEAWRRNETRYTQIDWDGLIARNRLADGEAVYALEERMTRTARMQLELRLTTEVDSRLTLRYGLSADIDNRRNYKRMRDLLGARYLTDIDQYLVDDDTYSNLLQNDLRHPDRRIGEGDRFGYDYALQAQRIRAHIDAEYRTDRLTARLHASLGYDLHFRRDTTKRSSSRAAAPTAARANAALRPICSREPRAGPSRRAAIWIGCSPPEPARRRARRSSSSRSTTTAWLTTPRRSSSMPSNSTTAARGATSRCRRRSSPWRCSTG